jgi:predicted metal-dependent enzyme (double-stranded beta helix superfamily)
MASGAGRVESYMFDLDQFVADCIAARGEVDAVLAVRDVLDRALAAPTAVAAALPAEAAELTPIYASHDLTVIKVVWGPGMKLRPHNHLMWAVNGMYDGEEDNVFYRRTDQGLVEAGGRHIDLGRSAVLGRDVIHAVTNPNARRCSGSIHIYGGDFMGKPRSMWDPETLEELPTDGETMSRLFAAARQSEG